MSDAIGWGVVALYVLMPLLLCGSILWNVLSRRPLEKRYGSNGGLTGGALVGFDAAFSPTAHEAGAERDRQTKRTAPAPAAGDPPWTIDGQRIRIDV